MTKVSLSGREKDYRFIFEFENDISFITQFTFLYVQ